jgi:hypothetical protein
MAKKKQFAGKKTKLAKLPLTQVLASQVEGVTASRPPLSPVRRLPPLTWEEVFAGHGEPLVAAFLFLVRELADLTSQLQSGPNPSVTNPRIFLPQRVPEHTGLVHALSEARESLKDLKGLLSPL